MTNKRMIRQATDWEKVFAILTSDDIFDEEYTKNQNKSTRKREITREEKGEIGFTVQVLL